MQTLWVLLGGPGGVSVGSATLAVRPRQQEPGREQGDRAASATSATGLSLLVEYPFTMVFFSLAPTSILCWRCEVSVGGCPLSSGRAGAPPLALSAETTHTESAGYPVSGRPVRRRHAAAWPGRPAAVSGR